MSLPGRRVEVNGIRLHVHEQGSGTPVLLLHGFPDSSSLWRQQVPALVGAGFRVVVPDLRGFGLSDRPPHVDDYAIQTLFGDASGILDALGIARAHVVCHDWGAALGWGLAVFSPERVERFAALSVGHFASFFEGGVEQREKSWYMLYFQYEGLAEESLQRDDWALFKEWTRNHSELPHWIADLARPGALTAALNWYRANMNPARPGLAGVTFPPVKVPTLGLWSSGDAYLLETQMQGSSRFCSGEWRYERIEDASHWMQLDQPARVNAVLLDWLGRA